LVKAGKIYAVGTEDMDALTFGSDVLLRHLTFSEARKMPIKEFHYQRILESMEMTPEQVSGISFVRFRTILLLFSFLN